MVGLYLTFKDGGEKNVLKMGGERTRLLLLEEEPVHSAAVAAMGLPGGLLSHLHLFTVLPQVPQDKCLRPVAFHPVAIAASQYSVKVN